MLFKLKNHTEIFTHFYFFCIAIFIRRKMCICEYMCTNMYLRNIYNKFIIEIETNLPHRVQTNIWKTFLYVFIWETSIIPPQVTFVYNIHHIFSNSNSLSQIAIAFLTTHLYLSNLTESHFCCLVLLLLL